MQVQVVPPLSLSSGEAPAVRGDGTGSALEPTGNRRPREMAVAPPHARAGTELGLAVHAAMDGLSDEGRPSAFFKSPALSGASEFGILSLRSSENPTPPRQAKASKFVLCPCLSAMNRKDTPPQRPAGVGGGRPVGARCAALARQRPRLQLRESPVVLKNEARTGTARLDRAV